MVHLLTRKNLSPLGRKFCSTRPYFYPLSQFSEGLSLLLPDRLTSPRFTQHPDFDIPICDFKAENPWWSIGTWNEQGIASGSGFCDLKFRICDESFRSRQAKKDPVRRWKWGQVLHYNITLLMILLKGISSFLNTPINSGEGKSL